MGPSLGLWTKQPPPHAPPNRQALSTFPPAPCVHLGASGEGMGPAAWRFLEVSLSLWLAAWARSALAARPVSPGNLACQLLLIRDRMLVCTSLCWVFYLLFECRESVLVEG